MLVNPGGTLDVTSCSVLSDSASGSTGHAGASGFNAAGGGVYASSGSTININGATNFVNDRVFAGKGSNDGSVGEAGGNAFGAGLAMAADVAEPPITTGALTASELSFTAVSGEMASFQGDRLNSGVLPSGPTVSFGGTGGAGSHTGGSGGDAFGAGLYMGSGQLNFNGGSTAAAVSFTGDVARAGDGLRDRHDHGARSRRYGDRGPGAYLSPSQVSVIDSTTTDGILQFTDDSETSYNGGTSTESGGLTLAAGQHHVRSGLYVARWALGPARRSRSAGPLAATGMAITVTLPALADGDTYSLTASATGDNSGSLAISSTETGSVAIVGGGASTTVIDGSGLGASVFTFSDADVTALGPDDHRRGRETNGGASTL